MGDGRGPAKNIVGGVEHGLGATIEKSEHNRTVLANTEMRKCLVGHIQLLLGDLQLAAPSWR